MLKIDLIKLQYFFVWMLATTFYLYENLLQMSQGVIVSQLMHDFNISAQSISMTIGSMFLISYSLAQFPIGIMLDRYKTKYLLTFAAAICSLSCYGYAESSLLIQASFFRFTMGFGAAFAALSCFKIAANFFSHKKFALLTGIMLSMGMLGAILAESLLLKLVNNYSWRQALVYIAYAGFVLTVLLFLFIKEKPKRINNKITFKQLLPEIKTIIQTRQSWLIAAYGMLMFSPFLLLSNLWGPLFLKQSYFLSTESAASACEYMFIGFIIGAPFFGFFSDKILSRKIPLYIANYGCLATILALLYWQLKELNYVYIIMFALGFFTSGFLPAFTLMKEIHSKHVTTTALGFMNTLNMLAAPILITFTGVILDNIWQGEVIGGTRVYSVINFKTAFILLPISYIISLFILTMIKETKCQMISTQHQER